MAKTNQALWLQEALDATMVVGCAPYPTKIEPDEIVIRTQAVAINPADWRLQRSGMLLTRYPAILGCDAAGVVEEVGSALMDTYKPGTRVIGSTSPLVDYKYSGFQTYIVLKEPLIAKIPETVETVDAVVLPLGMLTASTCLFDPVALGLETPPGAGGTGKTLIIWGASSSVGSCAVQLAVAAGYEVFAIASARNHQMVKAIGAAECFDYRDKDLVTSIVEALVGKVIVGACDVIGEQRDLETLCEILHQSGGKKMIATVMPGAESYSKLDVTIHPNFASAATTSGLADHIFKNFLEAGMTTGKIQYKPDAEVVGHGLDRIQAAVDRLTLGVSAKKLVVTI